MRTILVDAYFNNNLGDDLFLKILIDNFPNYSFQFLVKNEAQVRAFLSHDRISFIGRKEALLKVRNYDAFVYIGGSLFQEHKHWRNQYRILSTTIKWCKINSVPTFILGFNFGPYKNDQFLKKYTSLFKKVNSLSVRDKKSFELLKGEGLENISIHPDIVQSLNTSNRTMSNVKNTIIGFSIIDYPDMENEQRKKYIEKIVALLRFSNQCFEKIKLFSFQNTDDVNDLRMIKNEILSSITLDEFIPIEVISYTGDIDAFLNEYSECGYFVSGRFHSLILSIVFGQKILPYGYSEKVTNYLSSLSIDYYDIFSMDNSLLTSKDTINNFFYIDGELRRQLHNQSSEHFSELQNNLK